MKEQLIHFLENHQSLSWKIDASDYKILNLAINDFFYHISLNDLIRRPERDAKV